MKSSDQSPINNPEKSALNDLLKNGNPERNEEASEEFITPDPTRSFPIKNVGLIELDKMGISQKAKNQPSDERDTHEDKK